LDKDSIGFFIEVLEAGFSGFAFLSAGLTSFGNSFSTFGLYSLSVILFFEYPTKLSSIAGQKQAENLIYKQVDVSMRLLDLRYFLKCSVKSPIL
jgi:hypothetical protein